jgi:hypothetical protein
MCKRWLCALRRTSYGILELVVRVEILFKYSREERETEERYFININGKRCKEETP